MSMSATISMCAAIAPAHPAAPSGRTLRAGGRPSACAQPVRCMDARIRAPYAGSGHGRIRTRGSGTVSALPAGNGARRLRRPGGLRGQVGRRHDGLALPDSPAHLPAAGDGAGSGRGRTAGAGGSRFAVRHVGCGGGVAAGEYSGGAVRPSFWCGPCRTAPICGRWRSASTTTSPARAGICTHGTGRTINAIQANQEEGSVAPWRQNTGDLAGCGEDTSR